MPTPTSDELAAKAATIANSGIASTSVDGRSVSVADPLKILEVAQRTRKVGNGWNRISKAVVDRPGTTGQGDCE